MFKKIILTGLLFAMQALLAAPVREVPSVHRAKEAGSSPSLSQPMQVTRISREEIKSSPVVDLQALFKQQQSIVRPTHSSGDNSQSALSIRGFGDNAAANSLILVDGFPLTNPSLLAPNFNSIALIDIAGITVMQGSQGALWGDQAVGGVVSISTRHPEKWLGDSLLGVGSFNKRFFSALAGDKWTNGFFAKVFGFTEATHHYRQHNQQSDNNIRLTLGRDYASGTLSANLQAYTNQVNFPGGLSSEQFQQDPRQATHAKNNFCYQTQVLQLLNKQLFSAAWLLETRLAQQKMTGKGFIFIHSAVDEWQNNIEPRLIGRPNKNKMILGYFGQASQYHLKNKRVESRTKAYQHHVYAQTVVPLFSIAELTLGSRYAWQNTQAEKIIDEPIHSINRAWVGEVGLSFRPSKSLQFYLRRDGNFRFVKANEATWTPPNVSALQAQTGVSYEAGVSWSYAQYQTQLSLYSLLLQNEIAFDARQKVEEPFGSFRNFPRTQRLGITVTEHYQFSPRLILDAQLNYVDARFSAGFFSGKQIPAVPAWNGNVALNYEFISNGFLKYYVLYTGPRFASDDNDNVSSKLPPYWLNNLALQYMLNRFNLSFEIENVFNQIYSAYTWYDVSRNEKIFYAGAGRSYLLTFKMNLD